MSIELSNINNLNTTNLPVEEEQGTQSADAKVTTAALVLQQDVKQVAPRSKKALRRAKAKARKKDALLQQQTTSSPPKMREPAEESKREVTVLGSPVSLPKQVHAFSFPASAAIVPTHAIRFSQRTISCCSSDERPLKNLVKALFDTNHWLPGLPYPHVVRTADGLLVTLDNRRVFAAKVAGLEAIPAVVFNYNEEAPDFLTQQVAGRVSKDEIVRYGRDLGARSPSFRNVSAKEPNAVCCADLVLRRMYRGYIVNPQTPIQAGFSGPPRMETMGANSTQKYNQHIRHTKDRQMFDWIGEAQEHKMFR